MAICMASSGHSRVVGTVNRARRGAVELHNPGAGRLVRVACRPFPAALPPCGCRLVPVRCDSCTTAQACVIRPCLSEDAIEDNDEEQNVRNCGKLNPVGPEYNAGRIELENAGTWHFMSTRENNFSNRSHKSQIIVVEGMGAGETIGITAAVVLPLGAVGAAAFMGYKKKGAVPSGGGGGGKGGSGAQRQQPQRGQPRPKPGTRP